MPTPGCIVPEAQGRESKETTSGFTIPLWGVVFSLVGGNNPGVVWGKLTQTELGYELLLREPWRNSSRAERLETHGSARASARGLPIFQFQRGSQLALVFYYWRECAVWSCQARSSHGTEWHPIERGDVGGILQ